MQALILKALWQYKEDLGVAIALIFIFLYSYHNIVTVPERRIATLEKEVEVKTELPTIIVNKINKLDANRTQEEINDDKPKKLIRIRNSGVITFE